MSIDKDILEYLTQENYNYAIKDLEKNKLKKIYEDEKTIIKVIKRGRRIYTFINKFGTKKLDTALNNICSLVV
ncbi:hypothetical protein [Clostridium perfringens]|uniref:hypothetical protein n=1 Tax=Clostridium perfringens TaxID=1502 RepID=UPI002FCCEEB2